ncbi:hypothetical protein DLH72_01730 [Candidatus Gracilibacteria bacterium]|nr:MAG: hypothetical protein DLH72_01730 [Candidatus Gracilibacteria bacterium]
MNLFINTIAKKSYFGLFDKNKKLKDEIYFEIKGNESSLLLPKLEEFLNKNNLKYEQIENFILVNGPGSFTGVRTVVLAINTINFITKKSITPISYFDLFDDFPIIKSSSKRDSFFKKDKNSDVEIWENEKIKKFLDENNIKKIYGEGQIENLQILENIKYCDIINKIELKDFKRVEALYVKKPNIS